MYDTDQSDSENLIYSFDDYFDFDPNDIDSDSTCDDFAEFNHDNDFYLDEFDDDDLYDFDETDESELDPQDDNQKYTFNADDDEESNNFTDN